MFQPSHIAGGFRNGTRSEVPLNLSTGEQGSKGRFWMVLVVGDWDFDGF